MGISICLQPQQHRDGDCHGEDEKSEADEGFEAHASKPRRTGQPATVDSKISEKGAANEPADVGWLRATVSFNRNNVEGRVK